MQASTKHIALFGGSFDPVHNGHVAICEFLAMRRDIDEIIVMPCAQHAFAKELSPFEQRVRMCQCAFATLPNVTVSTLEQELGDTNYTADTVRALLQQYPGATISIVIGSDVAQELERWHDIDWLRKHVQFLTLKRGPDSPIPDVSATEIRERLAAGEDVSELVPGCVAAIIAP